MDYRDETGRSWTIREAAQGTAGSKPLPGRNNQVVLQFIDGEERRNAVVRSDWRQCVDQLDEWFAASALDQAD